MTSNTQEPDIAKIRQLLLEAFTPEDLRRFCRDRPIFRPIVDEFHPSLSVLDMVDRVVEYCDRHVLLDQLLAEVKEHNPGQYARFRDELIVQPHLEHKHISMESERQTLYQRLEGLELYLKRQRLIQKWALIAAASLLFFTLATVAAVRWPQIREALFPTATPFPTPTPSVAISTLNVTSELQANGFVKYTAQLSIETLGYGDLQLIAPSTMSFGESGIVQLTITPDSALGALLPVTVDTLSATDPSYAIPLDDRIQIYPLMIAELNGVNFQIEPAGPQRKAVTSESQVVWSWSVTPRTPHQQSLFLTISIPVLIDQTHAEVSKVLKHIPISIYVEITPTPVPSPTPVPTPTPTPLPFPRRFAEGMADDPAGTIAPVCSFLGALLAAAIAAYAAIKNSWREKSIKDLETQQKLAQAEEETTKLKREIAHLKSIKWWQFWRK